MLSHLSLRKSCSSRGEREKRTRSEASRASVEGGKPNKPEATLRMRGAGGPISGRCWLGGDGFGSVTAFPRSGYPCLKPQTSDQRTNSWRDFNRLSSSLVPFLSFCAISVLHSTSYLPSYNCNNDNDKHPPERPKESTTPNRRHRPLVCVWRKTFRRLW